MSRKTLTLKASPLEQYRAAVCDLMVSIFEHDLISAHLDRMGRLTGEAAIALQAVRHELGKRLARFTLVASQRWLKETILLEIACEPGDERNKEYEKKKRSPGPPVRIPA